MRQIVDFSPDATRRPGVEGVPFTLADGGSWHLATPRMFMRPKFTPHPEPETGRAGCELEYRWDYPREARAQVRALLDAVAGGEDFPLSVIPGAAVPLLRLCHDVPEDFAATLFDFTQDQHEDLAVAMLRMFRGERPGDRPTDDPGAIERAA